MKRLAALAALRLSLYLKGRVDSAFFARYSRLISPDVTREEIDSCPQEPEELFSDDPPLASRWRRLFDLCCSLRWTSARCLFCGKPSDSRRAR